MDLRLEGPEQGTPIGRAGVVRLEDGEAVDPAGGTQLADAGAEPAVEARNSVARLAGDAGAHCQPPVGRDHGVYVELEVKVMPGGFWMKGIDGTSSQNAPPASRTYKCILSSSPRECKN